MNKKKFIILTIITIILAASIPFAVSFISKQLTKDKIDVATLTEQFNKEAQTQIKEEKEKITKEYEDKITELKKENQSINTTMIDLGKIISNYYKDKEKNIYISNNIDETNFKLLFDNSKEPIYITDNNKNQKNSYTINDNIAVIENGKKLKQDLIITIKTADNEKFDINNNELLIKYLNALLGEVLTDDDKTAINVKVNMDLKDVKSIDELKNYIYNDESVKIKDLIIKTTFTKDGNSTNTEFKINRDIDNKFWQETKDN